MTISKVEHLLTVHIRRLVTQHISTLHLKVAAFTTSLSSCLFIGAILTISLYTPYFTEKLGYSQLQINLIGSFISLGMYLPLPVLGYLADAHGPVILSVISLLMLAPGYYIVALVYDQNLSFETILAGFLLIGCGTSSLYFACLLSCAKIYPHFKSLSISGPITCYGLSSFIISKLVLSFPYFQDGQGHMDISKIFTSLSVLFVVLSFLNWIASSIVTIEKDVLFSEDTETTSLLPEQEVSHHARFRKFLHDKSMYLLFLSLLLCVGPLESFIINISSFSDVLSLDNSSELIKFSVCSTLARLVFGILIEMIDATLLHKISIILCIFLVQFLGSISSFYPQRFLPLGSISALFGIAYGGIFTVYPTTLVNIWGVDIFGSTWGLFMLAPAFGSILFGLIYGVEFDKYCLIHADTLISNVNCLYHSFAIVSAGILVSAILIIIGWRLCWRNRNL